MHQFPNYSQSNRRILKEHQNYVPIRYVKRTSSKIISRYIGDNSHALEQWNMANKICKYNYIKNNKPIYTADN